MKIYRPKRQKKNFGICRCDQFSEQRKSRSFFFVFWDDKFSFICGETPVYYMIYHEEYFLLSNQRRLG